MKINKIMAATAAVCAAVFLSAVSELGAQTPTPAEHPHAAAAKAGPHADMDAKCKAMMADREKMMAEMKANDVRLDDLVSKMNAASSADKTTATAAVVTEMVAQRRSMRENMDKMQHGMMSHMMEHMQGGKGPMAMCPMMKSLDEPKPMGDMKH